MVKLLEVGKKYKHTQVGYTCTCIFSSKQHLIVVLDRDPHTELRLTGDAASWFKEYKKPRRILKYFNVYENTDTGELETGAIYNSFEPCERFKYDESPKYKLVSTGQVFFWEEPTDDKE